MVLLHELERDRIPDLCRDIGWVEDKLARTSNNDLMVGRHGDSWCGRHGRGCRYNTG